MSSSRALPTLSLAVSISLTFAAATGNTSQPSTDTEEMIAALEEQGVAPGQIWAIDPDGIPVVCAEPAGEGFAPAASLETSAAAVLPPGTRSWEAVPSVVRSDGTESFRFEVDANGPVNRVRFLDVFPCLIPPQPPPFELRDDGAGGDRIAGDSIYTSGPFRYDPACIFTPPAFFRNDPSSPAGIWTGTIGNVAVEELGGIENQFLIQPTIGVVLPSLPATPVRALAPNVVASPHLVNVRTARRSTQNAMRGSSFTMPELTAAIYAVLPDAFDFLMFFSVDHVERLPRLTGSNFNAGIHYTVQRNYSGTGGFPFDGSASYGSAGRLLSLNILDTLQRGVSSGNAMHEITHQWASYTSTFLGLADGTAHYSFRSSAASLVGGSRFIEIGNGSFVLDCTEGRNGAHRAPLIDRYMAGLIPGGEVGPLHLYSSALPGPLLLCDQTLAIDRTVTIEQIQAEHGVRTPGPGSGMARRDFAVGFVAESYDRLLTSTEMTFYEILAAHFARQLAASAPDPYLAFNWVPGTRFWGPGVTWTSSVPLPPALPVLRVALDLKPGRCPNLVNLGSRGEIPAALVGTADLDVRKVDPASIRVLGLAPVRMTTDDVAAPFFPLIGRNEAQDCTTRGPDRRLDLTLKLSGPDLAAAVEQHLGRPPRNGELVVVPLSGRLLPAHGGREIRGEDVLVVLGGQ